MKVLAIDAEMALEFMKILDKASSFQVLGTLDHGRQGFHPDLHRNVRGVSIGDAMRPDAKHLTISTAPTRFRRAKSCLVKKSPKLRLNLTHARI